MATKCDRLPPFVCTFPQVQELQAQASAHKCEHLNLIRCKAQKCERLSYPQVQELQAQASAQKSTILQLEGRARALEEQVQLQNQAQAQLRNQLQNQERQQLRSQQDQERQARASLVLASQDEVSELRAQLRALQNAVAESKLSEQRR